MRYVNIRGKYHIEIINLMLSIPPLRVSYTHKRFNKHNMLSYPEDIIMIHLADRYFK